MSSSAYTVHGVLAAAYRGKESDRGGLYHASADGGETALCGGVKTGHLADVFGTPPEQHPTCTKCVARIAKTPLTRPTTLPNIEQ